MKNNYFNQRISCNVSQCKHFDSKEERCSLGSIHVGVNLSTTCCDSFEQKNELQ